MPKLLILRLKVSNLPADFQLAAGGFGAAVKFVSELG
jgi:hypothetical protein